VNIITVEPDKDHPMPDSFKDETGDTFHENVNIAANTAVFLSGLGMPYEMTEDDAVKAQELFENVAKHKASPKPSSELTQTGVVLALSGYLKEYGSVVVSNAAETRNLIQNRLLEISRCGDPKHELKALELLGKMSDIGVFTEKSELVITHKTANELKEAIRDKINRLLNSDVIDVESFSDGLEEELNLDEPEEVEQVEEPEQVEEYDSDDPK
jgi:hypothetical protein